MMECYIKTILVANINDVEYNASFKTCFGMSVVCAGVYIYIYKRLIRVDRAVRMPSVKCKGILVRTHTHTHEMTMRVDGHML